MQLLHGILCFGLSAYSFTDVHLFQPYIRARLREVMCLIKYFLLASSVILHSFRKDLGGVAALCYRWSFCFFCLVIRLYPPLCTACRLLFVWDIFLLIWSANKAQALDNQEPLLERKEERSLKKKKKKKSCGCSWPCATGRLKVLHGSQSCFVTRTGPSDSEQICCFCMRASEQAGPNQNST